MKPRHYQVSQVAELTLAGESAQHGQAHQLRAVGCTQPLSDLGQQIAHGVLRQAERLPDLRVRVTERHALHKLALTRGEPLIHAA